MIVLTNKQEANMNRLLIFTGILFLLTGCLVGPKYTRPDLGVPSSFIQQSDSLRRDSVANIQWWELYKDKALQNLIRISLEQNKDIKTAVARVEESRAVLGFSKANLYPSIGYDVKGGYNKVNENAQATGIGIDGEAYSLLGTLSWEVDLWGRIRHANRSAYAQLLADEDNQKAITISVVADVASLYFQLRGLDERLEISKNTVAAREESYRLISARFEKGYVAEIDKFQAEQQVAFAAANIPAIERDIVAVESALNVLLGRNPSALIRGFQNSEQQIELEIPAGLPSSVLEKRPDVNAAEQNLIAQTELIGVAQALRFPTLSLTGFAGVASADLGTLLENNSLATGFAGQLLGPIFQFGQNKRRVEIEKKRTEQLLYQYEKTVLIALGDVESSLKAVRSYRDEYSARDREVIANRNIVLLSRARYDGGFTTYLEVLESERQLYESELNRSFTKQNQLAATVQLYKALGGGW
ncbi:efflux transporter outer membrane subunit [Solitalea lacus]|uniref:efflux transporter outer membrane subunit n=1 Tax=Solitalea lacus TaxID=2911172 RepID=UPI001EDB77B0|nr:efflux transporter outer membrane subunit [Solitalea lacus]UKJ07870.1 efflux transporter outer membrane subunit [Solitalea lacus]